MCEDKNLELGISKFTNDAISLKFKQNSRQGRKRIDN